MAKTDGALPTVDEVHTVHKLICEKYELPNGAFEANIDTKIQRVIDDAGDVNGDDEYDIAARFLTRFLTRAPYNAGNMATGWLQTTIYLSRVGAAIEPDVLKMAPYVVESAPRYHPEEIAEWLRTGDINTDPFEEVNAA